MTFDEKFGIRRKFQALTCMYVYAIFVAIFRFVAIYVFYKAFIEL